ncbi:type IV pilus modification protein PilV [Gilvimarinus algae]|uniref:Type IV pilus modification protein PilV n=1 Tax=Gilvimarinus algae TaxID=3058037 RepID=A0ABT8T9I8_9GAMM|nr:type IV pilus modification protein PilV [Gilvimarinus sp. SDUM040014]MDO3380794.1 type IV pilus modification protein PilV [Gilvimarinus sp. SDUM040014]
MKVCDACSKDQSGVTLIEVMVTVLILATALMALAALQTRALQYNSSAYLRSQANIIAYDVLEQMRTASTYNALRSNGAVVQPDVDALASQLPGGTGAVECVARVCTVTLTWDEPNKSQESDAMERTSFAYASRI